EDEMTAVASEAPVVEVPRLFNAAAEYIDGPVTAEHGERTAYRCEGSELTYRELQALVNRTGNALAGLGVEMEQRIGVLLPNIPEFVAAFYGAMKVGAVPVAMSFAIAPAEQLFLLNDSRARSLVVEAGLWAALR